MVEALDCSQPKAAADSSLDTAFSRVRPSFVEKAPGMVSELFAIDSSPTRRWGEVRISISKWLETLAQLVLARLAWMLLERLMPMLQAATGDRAL